MAASTTYKDTIAISQTRRTVPDLDMETEVQVKAKDKQDHLLAQIEDEDEFFLDIFLQEMVAWVIIKYCAHSILPWLLRVWTHQKSNTATLTWSTRTSTDRSKQLSDSTGVSKYFD